MWLPGAEGVCRRRASSLETAQSLAALVCLFLEPPSVYGFSRTVWLPVLVSRISKIEKTRSRLGSILLDGLGGTVICNLLILFCGILSGVTLARSLGPGGRGELATAFLWPNVLMLFGDLGLGFAFSYFVARERDKVSELW